MKIFSFLKFFWLITFLGFSINQVYGTHVPGGNISYECIGNNTYVITLTVFEDCGTAFYSNGPETIDISNSCGLSFSSSIDLPKFL